MEIIKIDTEVNVTLEFEGKVYQRDERTNSLNDVSKIVWFSDFTNEILNENPALKKAKANFSFFNNIKNSNHLEHIWKNEKDKILVLYCIVETSIKLKADNGLTYMRYSTYDSGLDKINVFWVGNGYDENGFSELNLDNKNDPFYNYINNLELEFQRVYEKK